MIASPDDHHRSSAPAKMVDLMNALRASLDRAQARAPMPMANLSAAEYRVPTTSSPLMVSAPSGPELDQQVRRAIRKGYRTGVRVVGWFTFAASWAYAIAHYRFFLGVGLGWLPAAVIGFLAGLVWPVFAAATLIALVALAGALAWAAMT